jgi:hypothetical protein
MIPGESIINMISVFNCFPYPAFDIAEKQKELKGQRGYIEKSASK